MGAGPAGSGTRRASSGAGEAGHGMTSADRAHSDGVAGRSHAGKAMACDDPHSAADGAGAQSTLRGSSSEAQLLVRRACA